MSALNKLGWMLVAALFAGGVAYAIINRPEANTMTPNPKPLSPGHELATLGGGCFWCVEAPFQEVKGVERVESGYTGGKTENPTYHQICTGMTGHAEVVQIAFDPKVISYREILEIFFVLHDPTTLNRQGNDRGTQYRSAIFYHSPEQKATAEALIAELDKAKAWPAPIVTQVVPLEKYYPAEDYHQNYFRDNPNQPYCMAVIPPKLAKLRKNFASKLKTN